MKPFNILFLCTHNSGRSIIAEALASSHPSGKFIGYSAGSSPSSEVSPYALVLTDEMGYDRTKLRSKSWEEFALPNAPHMDFIITVCDNAAGEQCPYWPGNPATAHWGFPDPSLVQGSDEVKQKAYRDVKIDLKKRIDLLADLPVESLNSFTIRNLHNIA